MFKCEHAFKISYSSETHSGNRTMLAKLGPRKAKCKRYNKLCVKIKSKSKKSSEAEQT